jgi:hypothetical protein
VSGTLLFDPQTLQDASGGGGDTAGQAPIVLLPRGQAVRVLRVLPAAAGRRLELQVVGLLASGDTAAGADVRLDGEAVFDVPAMPAEAPK